MSSGMIFLESGTVKSGRWITMHQYVACGTVNVIGYETSSLFIFCMKCAQIINSSMLAHTFSQKYFNINSHLSCLSKVQSHVQP